MSVQTVGDTPVNVETTPATVETETSRVALPHSHAPAHKGAHRREATDSRHIMSVSLLVHRRRRLVLHELGGRHLSPANYAETYGADPESFARIRRFANHSGLTVDEAASSLDRRTIVLRGTVRAIERAFGVELHQVTLEDPQLHEYAGHTHHSYHGPITIPAELRDAIEAVVGLDARPLARPHVRHLDVGESHHHYSPSEIASIYGFPPEVDGTGETIALIELGGGYESSDLARFFNTLGQPAPTLAPVSIDGATNQPGPAPNFDAEVTLDIEIAGAIAPGAAIAVYFAPPTAKGLLDAITSAIHDPVHAPSVISISWGWHEEEWSRHDMLALDSAILAAAALGVTVLASAGDRGSSDGQQDGLNHVHFPASSPHVLACGGTRLETRAGERRVETVWNDDEKGATGGGVSRVFPRPAWQDLLKVPPAETPEGGRGLPDVAANASSLTGYRLHFGGRDRVGGGTSAVTPLWAGLVARINQVRTQQGLQRLGLLQPLLYASSAGFYPVTEGSNGHFTAGPGWDACTGLGTPMGQELYRLLSEGASAPAMAEAVECGPREALGALPELA